jgi:two-component system, response regulator RegA
MSDAPQPRDSRTLLVVDDDDVYRARVMRAFRERGVEWEHIQRVLADCDGNISEAARRLQVHRRSLQRKLSKYPAPEGHWRS